MSSNDNSDVPLANTSLTKRTKSGRLSQLPQSRRPEGILNPLVCVFVENIDRIVIGAPPLQRRAPSPVVILPSPKTVRCKARSEEEDLADLGLAFKRQRQSGMPNSLLPIPTDSERQLLPLVCAGGFAFRRRPGRNWGRHTHDEANGSSTIEPYQPDSNGSESQDSDNYGNFIQFVYGTSVHVGLSQVCIINNEFVMLP